MDMKWIAYVHDIAWTAADGTPLSGFAYTYDAAGNVTRIVRDGRPTLDLTWNGQYQLVSVATNGVFAEGYAYDALGRRASTTTWEGTVRHVYDDNWQVIADLDSNGNVLRSYVWGEGIDRLLAVKVGAKSYAALTDAQGTVWGLVGGDGEIVARWTYDAWGYVLSEEVTDPDLATFRYRFQGREYSAVTGLTNFRMRWYDPGTGRWLSKDPIGLIGGMNLYAFCGDNSVCRSDPYGKNWVAGAITAGVLAYGIYKFFKYSCSVNEKMESRDINDLRDIIDGAIDVSSEMMSTITSPTGIVPDKLSPLIDPIIEPITDKIWDSIFDQVRPLK